LDEPDLLGLLGRLEDDAILIDEVGDLLHQAGAHLAVRPVEPGRAAFACLADDLPTTRFQLGLDGTNPSVGRHDPLVVFRADLAEHRKFSSERLDAAQLLVVGDEQRAVGDLDLLDAQRGEEPLVVIELIAQEVGLEERTAEIDGHIGAAVDLELALEARRDGGRSPSHLDEIHVLGRYVQHVLHLARSQTLIEHQRESEIPRLRGTLRDSVHTKLFVNHPRRRKMASSKLARAVYKSLVIRPRTGYWLLVEIALTRTRRSDLRPPTSGL